MKVQSEFDRYVNMSYVELDIGGYCYDNGRFLRKRTMSEQIDSLEVDIDKNEEIAICAKMELEFVSPNYRQN